MKNSFDELNQAALDAISERAMEDGIARMFNGIEKLEKPTGPIKPWPSPPEQMVWLKDIFPELAEEAGISITFKDVEKLEPADTKKSLGHRSQSQRSKMHGFQKTVLLQTRSKLNQKVLNETN